MSNNFYDLPSEGIVTLGTTETSFVSSGPILQYKTDNDKQFKKAHFSDAGYDLVAAKAGQLQAHTRDLIETGLYLAIPDGYVGVIKPRSGLAWKHGIDVMAGVIDSGYRGEIKVLLINHSDEVFSYDKDSKIAQILIIPIFTGFEDRVKSLEDSDRGEQGFNSTGYKAK